MCEFKLGFSFLNLAVPILAHFFTFNNPLGLFQKPASGFNFHVHFSHSSMLDIVWIQSFIRNSNHGLCKYAIQSLIKNLIFIVEIEPTCQFQK